MPFHNRRMPEVITREKEIRYSSRTRAGTAEFTRSQKLRRAAATLLEKLPADLKAAPEAELLGTIADCKVFNLVHLIYRTIAGTIESVRLDDDHGLRISIRGHSGFWPVSKLKKLEPGREVA